MKRLPIGIQTFEKVITGDYLYIDKTPYIYDLIQNGEVYFLSRPRRFGKSLLISTLKSIFLGKKELFKGLFIYDKIDWDTFPVIHIDFSCIVYSEGKDVFKDSLIKTLIKIGHEYNIEITETIVKSAFIELIEKLSKINKVVILIDEYDKPIVDYISDISKANENRKILRDFYSALKGLDSQIKFVLLTGVSKFAKVSVFSGLNNLRDITLSKEYASMLGYTQDELEQYFPDRIKEFMAQNEIDRDKLLKEIKNWYNGYSWDGKNKVYNPFSILNLFADYQFMNYWFETGTPHFLIEHIRKNKIEIPGLETGKASNYLFESYNLDDMNILSLLFQTGYLTIKKITVNSITEETEYHLSYPNREVSRSLFNYLFHDFTGKDLAGVQILHNEMKLALYNEEIDKFIQFISSILASIPYTLHLEVEAYYHSLFYLVLKLMGCTVNLEMLSDKGRVDAVLEFDETIYIIEFKLGSAKKAMKQIKSKKYFQPYISGKKKILLLGVGFKNKEVEYLLEELK
ncbi:MAG: AAA family ATPase [bacterium]|nr:AAA family ATPase [bacterium]